MELKIRTRYGTELALGHGTITCKQRDFDYRNSQECSFQYAFVVQEVDNIEVVDLSLLSTKLGC